MDAPVQGLLTQACGMWMSRKEILLWIDVADTRGRINMVSATGMRQDNLPETRSFIGDGGLFSQD
jgi:hypothetical protein